MPREGESITALRIGGLQIVQAQKGYRFSVDPVLLAHFVAAAGHGLVVDLGAGSGVIPLLLAQLTDAEKLLGVELQEEQVRRARRSVELNRLADRVEIIAGDVCAIRDLLPAGGADLVVSNPPYRKAGSGRVSPGDERAAARHELCGGLAEFVAAAAWLLKNGGRFGVIYLAERLPELLARMADSGIEPKRLRLVHPRQGEAARMVLVEGRKHGRPGLLVEAPLYIYRGAGRDYNPEVAALYEAR